jgi:hypothetical protein
MKHQTESVIEMMRAAAKQGDWDTADLCDRALAGSAEAWARIAELRSSSRGDIQWEFLTPGERRHVIRNIWKVDGNITLYEAVRRYAATLN